MTIIVQFAVQPYELIGRLAFPVPLGQVTCDRQQAAKSAFSAQPAMCVKAPVSPSTHGGVGWHTVLTENK